MFELHITPKPDFLDDFVDIAQRFKMKLIKHTNLDINGSPLYLETMIAEKCKDLSELNYKMDLLFRTARQHNLLRVKVETEIKDDFSFHAPYRIGSTYYEVHMDIEASKINNTINYICYDNKLAISKNPDKSTYMLTFRCTDLEEYKVTVRKIQKDLTEREIPIKRILKEYCFLDDNLAVDNPWLEKYNF